MLRKTYSYNNSILSTWFSKFTALVGVGFEFGFINGSRSNSRSSCCSSSSDGGLYVFSISVIRLPVYILSIKFLFGFSVLNIFIYTNTYKRTHTHKYTYKIYT